LVHLSLKIWPLVATILMISPKWWRNVHCQVVER